MICDIINTNCIDFLENTEHKFDLTFLDPPFNQNKNYNSHNDKMDPAEYWEWMENVCNKINQRTSPGGAIYFMQREKNVKEVINVLEKSNWEFQNLIIWRKKASAVPSNYKYGKHYQILVFATKGKKARIFNKLRIDPPLLVTEKYKRPNGMFVTDVWDDIRELTSGYFAGDEPLRLPNGERLHNQQSPIKLLLRIILSSSKIGDFIFDPFSGTATTCAVARQLERNSVGIEKDGLYYEYCLKRLNEFRDVDRIDKYKDEYKYTKNL
ncbi:MAG: site-specific DNA-methyltransferase, partial [Candidatus Lokiarchaeota archaeon]|nr:site-specific DNA-methyltransferase [Candidatus Lokiarchaeota archaeon]